MTYQRLNQGYRGRFRTNFEMFGRMTEALVFRVCSDSSIIQGRIILLRRLLLGDVFLPD